MKRFLCIAILSPFVSSLLLAQADYKVYTSHPRLWLEGRRLNRLQKDVERQSERWRNLQRLVQADVVFPEEPLLEALLFQVTGDEESGRKAIAWAAGETDSGGFEKPDHLRLGAVVFDWCHELLSAEQKESLAQALFTAAEGLSRENEIGLARVRSGVMALVAVGEDHVGYERVLQTLMKDHWEERLLPLLRKGELLEASAELVALAELSHVARRNFEIEIWGQASDLFRALPLRLMLRVSPRPHRTEEGIFRLPVETDRSAAVIEGTLNRIAAMVFVAYENTLSDYQFLQGWVRHDAYTLYTPLGAVYEFLWVNPYLPGLSYFSAPLVFHDEFEGRVYARTGWQEEDLWAGYFDGRLLIVADGEEHVIEPTDKQAPLVFPGGAMLFGKPPLSFDRVVPEGKAIYVVGLEEGRSYEVRVNRSRARYQQAGKGGILVIDNRPQEGSTEIDWESRVRLRVRVAK